MNGLSYSSFESIYPNLLLKRDCSCLLVNISFLIFFSKKCKNELKQRFLLPFFLHKGVNFHFYADDTQVYVHLSHRNASRCLSKVNLHRLQSIQNSAARIVTNSCKYTRITPVLRKLHWLPIQFRSEFKLATLVYKFIHIGFPK